MKGIILVRLNDNTIAIGIHTIKYILRKRPNATIDEDKSIVYDKKGFKSSFYWEYLGI